MEPEAWGYRTGPKVAEVQKCHSEDGSGREYPTAFADSATTSGVGNGETIEKWPVNGRP